MHASEMAASEAAEVTAAEMHASEMAASEAAEVTEAPEMTAAETAEMTTAEMTAAKTPEMTTTAPNDRRRRIHRAQRQKLRSLRQASCPARTRFRDRTRMRSPLREF